MLVVRQEAAPNPPAKCDRGLSVAHQLCRYTTKAWKSFSGYCAGAWTSSSSANVSPQQPCPGGASTCDRLYHNYNPGDTPSDGSNCKQACIDDPACTGYSGRSGIGSFDCRLCIKQFPAAGTAPSGLKKYSTYATFVKPEKTCSSDTTGKVQFAACSTPYPTTCKLDEDYKSNVQRTIYIRNRRYYNGFVAHAPSKATINLGGRFARLDACFGMTKHKDADKRDCGLWHLTPSPGGKWSGQKTAFAPKTVPKRGAPTLDPRKFAPERIPRLTSHRLVACPHKASSRARWMAILTLPSPPDLSWMCPHSALHDDATGAAC